MRDSIGFVFAAIIPRRRSRAFIYPPCPSPHPRGRGWPSGGVRGIRASHQLGGGDDLRPSTRAQARKSGNSLHVTRLLNLNLGCTGKPPLLLRRYLHAAVREPDLG